MTQTQQSPWWDYTYIDRFGQQDSQGNYWQPDINVQIPGNYPIEAILSGTVSNVQQTGWGQSVITIQLDNALNSLATYSFYEHLSSVSVTQGEHINAGQLIGYNNPQGQTPLGFGLYSGPIYGSGSAWNILQQDLAPGGSGMLDPTKWIAQLSQSTHGGYQSATQPASTSSDCPVYCWFITGAGSTILIDQCKNCPFATSTSGTQSTSPFATLGSWLSNPIRIVKMVVGILCIGLAIFLIASPDAANQVRKVAPFL